MNNKNLINENLVSNLSDEQLGELLAYTPAFSETNLENIKTIAFKAINTKKKISVRKVALSLFAAALLLVMSTAVLASMTNFDFGRTFNSFFINPAATNIMDVGVSVEVGGIEITVLHAHTDGREIYAMLELRDQENRLREDIRLIFDMNSFAHVVTPIVHDEANDRLLMGINLSRMVAPVVQVGEYVSFSIESILIGAERQHISLELPLYVHAIEREMITEEEWVNDVIYRSSLPLHFYDVRFPGGPEKYLKPGELNDYLPGIDWTVLTNIGFYDGYLHIQTRNTDAWNSDSNFGFFYLLDRDGAPMWGNSNRTFGNYTVNIFHIGNVENLTETTLAFNGVMADSVIDGSWDLTFPITARAERKQFLIELQDSLYFRWATIQISPMFTSISLSPKGENDVAATRESLQRMIDYTDSFDTPFITLTDGSKIALSLRDSMFGPEGGSFDLTSLYFDISQLYSITVLGVEYILN